MAKGRKKFWRFRNAVSNDKVGELDLYGPISDYTWWGDEITPRQFKDDLEALGDIDELRIYINSDGGDVFAGQAIHSMLKRHEAHKIVYIDGLAASIASVVAVVGDEVRMPRNAMMMVHNPQMLLVGYLYANELRQMADALDKIGETIVAAYQQKSGQEVDEIKALMDAETWLTADEALEFGLVDEIEESKQVAASLHGSILAVNGQEFDLSRFDNAPKLAFLSSSREPPDESRESEPNEPDEPATEQPSGLLSTFARRIEHNRNKRSW